MKLRRLYVKIWIISAVLLVSFASTNITIPVHALSPQSKFTNEIKMCGDLKLVLEFLAESQAKPEEVEADVLMVLGSHDMQVPQEAARLYAKMPKKPKTVIFSGGIGWRTRGLTEGEVLGSEAEVFREEFKKELVKLGMIADEIAKIIILTETNSTNTGDNIKFSKQLLEENRLLPKSVILMQTPALQRRSVATFKRWFGSEVKCTSYTYMPDVGNMNDGDLESLAELAVGEIDRISKYGPSGEGFMVEVQIPQEITGAAQRLQKILGDVQPEQLPDGGLRRGV